MMEVKYEKSIPFNACVFRLYKTCIISYRPSRSTGKGNMTYRVLFRESGIKPMNYQRESWSCRPEKFRKKGFIKKCIIFDSVSIMLIYSSSVNLSRFLHFVTNKLRLADVSGIFLSVEKGIDPFLLSQITSYVDRIIEGDKGVTV